MGGGRRGTVRVTVEWVGHRPGSLPRHIWTVHCNAYNGRPERVCYEHEFLQYVRSDDMEWVERHCGEERMDTSDWLYGASPYFVPYLVLFLLF